MEYISIEENNNNIVKKCQKMIHDSHYDLSTLATKIFLLVVAQIKKDDVEFYECIIKLADFKKWLDVHGNDSAKYKKIVGELKDKSFYIDDKELKFVSISRYAKDGFFIFKIHDDLKPYLLKIQAPFLRYDISNIVGLKSKYHIKLYELCKEQLNRYGNNKYNKAKQYTFDIKINYFYENMGVAKTTSWSQIQTRILDVAIKEFMLKTDIVVTYEESKKIRKKVIGIVMTVKINDNKNDLKEINELISRLKESV